MFSLQTSKKIDGNYTYFHSILSSKFVLSWNLCIGLNLLINSIKNRELLVCKSNQETPWKIRKLLVQREKKGHSKYRRTKEKKEQ
jgi:hypothetical protein